MASILPLFVPAIRDYIDVLNNAYDSISSNSNLQQILQQSILYFASSIKFIIIYLFSFQWVQDLSYLPIVIPQIKLEILKEHLFLETPQSSFFTFLETPSYNYNKFLLGLANSFFLCLPLSVAHIISVRRLLIQGLAAGISSSFGTISGQILILICILFGGRFFITPWFNFQILNYFVGIWLVFKVCYEMANERSIRMIDSSEKNILIRIFFINFALAWTEQSCIFQYFGNLTFGAEPSIIEIFSSASSLQSVLVHINYILGIIVGSVLFTSIFILTTLKVSDLSVRVLSILYSRWLRRLNFSLIIAILAFTFTSIPFYSFEYLVLSNLGFTPQDKSFKNTNTVFSYTKIQDFDKAVLGNQDGNFGPNQGIVTDISRFNKGRYLMFDVNDSFEQLNYKGEYNWFIRRSRAGVITLDISSSAAFSKVSKFFKKGQKFGKQSEKKKFVDMSTSNNTPSNDNTILTDISKNNNTKKVFSFRNQADNVINQSFENLINTSASRKFFVSEETNLSNLEKNFKQKYYSNPIYKLLLSADIDFFLSRQPTSFLLSPKEEQDLFKKRTVLANYYDSLRYYNKLPSASEFQDFFNGSKSYADRIYNHQFNGTLKVVRRLFSINIDSTVQPSFAGDRRDPSQTSSQKLLTSIKKLSQQKNSQNTRQNKFLEKSTYNFVLKFDQPLYKKITARDGDSFQGLLSSSFHEELNPRTKNDVFYNGENQKVIRNFNDTTSRFDLESQRENGTHKVSGSKENLPKDLLSRNNSPDSEHLLRQKMASTNSNKPFIELVNPMPFYVGWDEQLRKLVITNRISPNYCAGESMKFPGVRNQPFSFGANEDNGGRKNEQGESTAKNYTNEYLTLNKLLKKNKTINFTAWPISHQSQQSSRNQTSYNLLADSLIDEENNLKFRTLIEDDLNLKQLLDGDVWSRNIYGELASVPRNILTNGQPQYEISPFSKLKDTFPYTRGGFVWPGHSDLKFKFKEPVS